MSSALKFLAKMILVISLCLPLQAWSASHDLDLPERDHAHHVTDDSSDALLWHSHTSSHHSPDHDHSQAALFLNNGLQISLFPKPTHARLEQKSPSWLADGPDKPPRG